MSTKINVNDSRNLWVIVKDRLKLKGENVEIGFFPNATYPDGTQVAQVAFWNEHGTNHKVRTQAMGFRAQNGRMVFSTKAEATFEQDVTIGEYDIPPRPFMKTASEKYADKALNVGAKSIGDGSGEKVALRLAASYMSDMVKREITTLSEPPNKPSTVRKKGRSNPLINTARMRNSVTWRLKGGGV